MIFFKKNENQARMNFLFIFVFLSQTDTQFLEQVTQKVFKKKNAQNYSTNVLEKHLWRNRLSV